jgi:hypothetical protein
MRQSSHHDEEGNVGIKRSQTLNSQVKALSSLSPSLSIGKYEMAGLDIQGIAQLGPNLASSLDLHAEACYKARRNGLPKLVSLVHSTCSTLQKLHDLSQQGPKVFTGVCINDINALAATCDILYKGILILLVERSEYLERDNDIGHMTKERVEHLLCCLTKKTFSMAKTWEWLDPRLKICEQELTQVKFELMLRLLVVSIAQFQLRFVPSHDTRLLYDTDQSQSALRCDLRGIGRVKVRCDDQLKMLPEDAWHTTSVSLRGENAGRRKIVLCLLLGTMLMEREALPHFQGKFFYLMALDTTV